MEKRLKPKLTPKAEYAIRLLLIASVYAIIMGWIVALLLHFLLPLMGVTVFIWWKAALIWTGFIALLSAFWSFVFTKIVR